MKTPTKTFRKVKSHVIGDERQAELCYADTIKVIADAKQKLFDVTKLFATLQSLVLGFSFSKETQFSIWFAALPMFVGALTFALNYAISTELEVHRKTLANLRKEIGGLVYRMNKDQADYYSDGKNLEHSNYFKAYRNANAGTIIAASLVASFVILMQGFQK